MTTKAAVKHFNGGGTIINSSSAVTSLNPPNTAVFTGTKGAVDSITGVLANKLGPRKIRVNAINPGGVVTEGTVSAGFIGSDFEKDTIGQTPLGRIGQPGDISAVSAFLASDHSAWLTGSTLVASAGLCSISPTAGVLDA